MPRLTRLLLLPLLLLAAPAAHAGNAFFEGFVFRGDGVELRIGNNRYVPYPPSYGWPYGHPGFKPYGFSHDHPRVEYFYGNPGYDSRDVRQAWRQGFDAGRRQDDGPRWYGGWSR